MPSGRFAGGMSQCCCKCFAKLPLRSIQSLRDSRSRGRGRPRFCKSLQHIAAIPKLLNQDAFSAALIQEPPAPMPSVPLLSASSGVQKRSFCPRHFAFVLPPLCSNGTEVICKTIAAHGFVNRRSQRVQSVLAYYAERQGGKGEALAFGWQRS